VLAGRWDGQGWLECCRCRGKLLEKSLADLCAVEGIQVREPFEIREGGTPQEQIDGLIIVGGHFYLVEVRRWNDPIGIDAMSSIGLASVLVE
jgi:restriction system protein